MGCGASLAESPKSSSSSSTTAPFVDEHAPVLLAVDPVTSRPHRQPLHSDVFHEVQHTSVPYSRKISQTSVTDGGYNLSSSANPQPHQEDATELTPRFESFEPQSVTSIDKNETVTALATAANDDHHLCRASTSQPAIDAGSPKTPAGKQLRQNLRDKLKKSSGADFQSIILPSDMLIAFPPPASSLLRAANSDDEDMGNHLRHQHFQFAMDTIPPLRTSGVHHPATNPLMGSGSSSSPTHSRRESSSCWDHSIHRNSTTSVGSPLREGRVRTIQFLGETQCLLRSEISESSVGDGMDLHSTIVEPRGGILAAETSFGEEIASTHVSSSPGSATSFETGHSRPTATTAATLRT